VAEGPTFVIDQADLFGVPAEAHCSVCGWRWGRPADDPTAETLPRWARMHRCPGPPPPH
jgi:hypothetical protein